MFDATPLGCFNAEKEDSHWITKEKTKEKLECDTVKNEDISGLFGLQRKPPVTPNTNGYVV